MTAQIQGDSQEAVAFGLMKCVLHAAGRGNEEHPFPAGSTLLRGQEACKEHEILTLYARCLRVVQGADPAALPPPNPTLGTAALGTADVARLHS